MGLGEVLGLLALGFGVFFCVVGIIGLLRFPDVYCRIHASGKVSTVGIVGLLVGASLLMPEITLKALGLALFMVIASPIASHAIASAAYRQGVPLVLVARDDLAGRGETL
ncbi:MAG: monovalent cation/H(+) antiporter subunit G [Anaerolineae bacterium]|nr:monovalent cation/H(+) antiporter subunit G [Anaerolineae bacterium]